MPQNITIPLKDLSDAELANILKSVEEKVERLRTGTRGVQPAAYWSAVIELVKIRNERDLRKAKYKDTF